MAARMRFFEYLGTPPRGVEAVAPDSSGNSFVEVAPAGMVATAKRLNTVLQDPAEEGPNFVFGIRVSRSGDRTKLVLMTDTEPGQQTRLGADCIVLAFEERGAAFIPFASIGQPDASSWAWSELTLNPDPSTNLPPQTLAEYLQGKVFIPSGGPANPPVIADVQVHNSADRMLVVVLQWTPPVG